MVIYNYNKDKIGDNPGIVRPGTVLDIPDCPRTQEEISGSA